MINTPITMSIPPYATELDASLFESGIGASQCAKDCATVTKHIHSCMRAGRFRGSPLVQSMRRKIVKLLQDHYLDWIGPVRGKRTGMRLSDCMIVAWSYLTCHGNHQLLSRGTPSLVNVLDIQTRLRKITIDWYSITSADRLKARCGPLLMLAALAIATTVGTMKRTNTVRGVKTNKTVIEVEDPRSRKMRVAEVKQFRSCTRPDRPASAYADIDHLLVQREEKVRLEKKFAEGGDASTDNDAEIKDVDPMNVTALCPVRFVELTGRLFYLFYIDQFFFRFHEGQIVHAPEHVSKWFEESGFDVTCDLMSFQPMDRSMSMAQDLLCLWSCPAGCQISAKRDLSSGWRDSLLTELCVKERGARFTAALVSSMDKGTVHALKKWRETRKLDVVQMCWILVCMNRRFASVALDSSGSGYIDNYAVPPCDLIKKMPRWMCRTEQGRPRRPLIVCCRSQWFVQVPREDCERFMLYACPGGMVQAIMTQLWLWMESPYYGVLADGMPIKELYERIVDAGNSR